MFTAAGCWKKCFFTLTQDILSFADLNDKTQILGKIHMKISTILVDDGTFEDGELRLNSGLIDVRLKAASIKEKVNWKNALTKAQIKDAKQHIHEQRLEAAKNENYKAAINSQNNSSFDSD